jgi:hypothetical protein
MSLGGETPIFKGRFGLLLLGIALSSDDKK